MKTEIFLKKENRKYFVCKCDDCGVEFLRRAELKKFEYCKKCSHFHKKKKPKRDENLSREEFLNIDCCVKGCGRKSYYKKEKLCQMHYFRRMRYGSFELTSTRKYKIYTPNGYCKVYEPNCLLKDKFGYVFEHRYVYLESKRQIDNCELCNRTINWKTVHIDHIDNDRLNNDISNLRALCNGCNTQRPKREKFLE